MPASEHQRPDRAVVGDGEALAVGEDAVGQRPARRDADDLAAALRDAVGDRLAEIVVDGDHRRLRRRRPAAP